MLGQRPAKTRRRDLFQGCRAIFNGCCAANRQYISERGWLEEKCVSSGGLSLTILALAPMRRSRRVGGEAAVVWRPRARRVHKPGGFHGGGRFSVSRGRGLRRGSGTFMGAPVVGFGSGFGFMAKGPRWWDWDIPIIPLPVNDTMRTTANSTAAIRTMETLSPLRLGR